MLGAILGFISNIINPVTEIIDELNTSEEERLAIKQKLFEMQTALSMKVMEYEQQLLKSKADIITAEAQGQSWIQRNWRPITMLTFLALVVFDSLGILANRLAPEAWTLLQIGLGGYVVGRSAEKIAPQIKDIMRKD
jgi:hypothetical protein